VAGAIHAIDDPADPRIAAYLQVRERDLAGRGGHFMAEGEVVLRTLLGPGSRCRAASLLVAENRLAKVAPLIETLHPGTPVYVAGQAVMDAVVGFPIHRGVLALGERPPDAGVSNLLATLPARALLLGLFGIGNHDNMGGLFRNAAAFGVAAVLLDPGCCDPLYRKAIRVSVGAALTVPFARLDEGEDMLDRLCESGFTALALSPGGGESVKDLRRPARAAVLMGAEGPGLPQSVRERARTIAIPMAPAWDSLNVAVASAIALHALA
jgi:tRNA G18 (ribose-2'-O)-methylase SpoU